MDRVKRITQMEECLDVSAAAVKKLGEALDEYEQAQKAFKKLNGYYGSTLWMDDFEADEAGKLPADLKRGVLSEDTVYNLILDNRELNGRMLRLVASLLSRDML